MSSTLPFIKIDNYGKCYKNNNYGAHCMKVTLGQLELWFSYKTVVAFRTPEIGLAVSKSIWGPTTGKHLNLIDSGQKGSRYPRFTFEQMLTEVLTDRGFSI